MESGIHPFLRRVEVLVGPLSELAGGGDEAAALRFIGNGTNEYTRIGFEVNKQYPTTCTPTTISLYNLSPGTRNALQVPGATGSKADALSTGARVILRAGWENTELTKVFQGTLLYCYHIKQGPDIITTLLSLAGAGAVNTAVVPIAHNKSGGGKSVNCSFVKGVKLNEIVFALASGFQNISVDPKNIVISDYTFGSAGWTFAGLASDGLNKLSRQYGFSWWIDNGKFFAKDDNKAFSTNNLVSSENGLLIRAEPMLTGPFSQKIGVNIHSMFNPAIDLGTTVQLESKINPDLNGNYMPTMIRHSGDTHSNQWVTAMESIYYNLAP